MELLFWLIQGNSSIENCFLLAIFKLSCEQFFFLGYAQVLQHCWPLLATLELFLHHSSETTSSLTASMFHHNLQKHTMVSGLGGFIHNLGLSQRALVFCGSCNLNTMQHPEKWGGICTWRKGASSIAFAILETHGTPTLLCAVITTQNISTFLVIYSDCPK